LDGSGKIRYTEFLAATIGDARTGDISEERLAEAFDRFDTDDSGYISVDNLAEILGTDFPRSEIQDIINDACSIDFYGGGKAGTTCTTSTSTSTNTNTNTIGRGGRRSKKNGNNEGSSGGITKNGTTQHQHISYSAFLALWERKNNEKEGSTVLRGSNNNNNNNKTSRTMKKAGGRSRHQQQQCMLSGLVIPIEKYNPRDDDRYNDGRRRRAGGGGGAPPLESINKAITTAAAVPTQ